MIAGCLGRFCLGSPTGVIMVSPVTMIAAMFSVIVASFTIKPTTMRHSRTCRTG
jgi:hypothetical protein